MSVLFLDHIVGSTSHENVDNYFLCCKSGMTDTMSWWECHDVINQLTLSRHHVMSSRCRNDMRLIVVVTLDTIELPNYCYQSKMKILTFISSFSRTEWRIWPGWVTSSYAIWRHRSSSWYHTILTSFEWIDNVMRDFMLVYDRKVILSTWNLI